MGTDDLLLKVLAGLAFAAGLSLLALFWLMLHRVGKQWEREDAEGKKWREINMVTEKPHG